MAPAEDERAIYQPARGAAWEKWQNPCLWRHGGVSPGLTIVQYSIRKAVL